MVTAENLYVVCSGGAADGKRAVVVNTTVVARPGLDDRIGMQRSDHIGARSKILSLTDAHDDAQAEQSRSGSRRMSRKSCENSARWNEKSPMNPRRRLSRMPTRLGR